MDRVYATLPSFISPVYSFGLVPNADWVQFGYERRKRGSDMFYNRDLRQDSQKSRFMRGPQLGTSEKKIFECQKKHVSETALSIVSKSSRITVLVTALLVFPDKIESSGLKGTNKIFKFF